MRRPLAIVALVLGVAALFAGTLLALVEADTTVDGDRLRSALDATLPAGVDRDDSMVAMGLDYLGQLEIDAECGRPVVRAFGGSVDAGRTWVRSTELDETGSMTLAAYQEEAQGSFVEIMRTEADSSCRVTARLRLAGAVALVGAGGWAMVWAGRRLRRAPEPEPSPPPPSPGPS